MASKVVKLLYSVVFQKRGFTNIGRKEYAIVNLDALNRFEDGTEVTAELLLETGVISKLNNGVKSSCERYT
ncbi:hypothetical protein GCM10020331_017470 [Ectobacillus funiculus]